MSQDPSTPDPRPAGEFLPEGEEVAPPGTRTMGIVRWALVALMALAAAGAWVQFSGLAGRSGSAAVQYHCPMHPAVLADHAGECPICGMDLVKVEDREKKPASGGETAAAAAEGAYWCPMHPEVTSDDPNATCPKCSGMRLLPRPKAGAAKQGVPGLVAVDLSPDRVQLIGMRTAPVTREKLSPTLRTVGIVTSDERGLALVTTRFGGWVESLSVSQTGQRVRKGEVLARIYSPEMFNAQLTYVNAIGWLKGTQPLGTGQATPDLDREARTRLLLAGVEAADVDEIRREGKPLRSLSVRAPISGYVGRKVAVVGLFVQPGSELFEIADLSTVWVLADVYESEIERVKVGQKATLEVAAVPGQTFTGQVTFLYPTVSAASRTLQARVEFRNPALKLRPGMYANVTLDVGSVDGLVVPGEAVVDTGEVQYVFVAREGGRFEPRRVKLGWRSEDKVQVLDGVSEGEKVVTTANFLVDSERRLRAAIEGFATSEQPPPAAPPPVEHGTGHGH